MSIKKIKNNKHLINITDQKPNKKGVFTPSNYLCAGCFDFDLG